MYPHWDPHKSIKEALDAYEDAVLPAHRVPDDGYLAARATLLGAIEDYGEGREENGFRNGLENAIPN